MTHKAFKHWKETAAFLVGITAVGHADFTEPRQSITENFNISCPSHADTPVSDYAVVNALDKAWRAPLVFAQDAVCEPNEL